MTTNDRPLSETAAVNCQADSHSLSTTPDKVAATSDELFPERIQTDLSSANLRAALELAADGFHVFPLDHPWWSSCRGAHHSSVCDGKRGKHPIGAWTHAASTNPEQVTRMFRNGPFNIGIACGPSNLLVVDEDGPNDLAVYAATLGLSGPDTRATITGRGAHLLFHHDHRVRSLGNGEGVLSEFDVNVRGAGGFIVGPGSLHQNGTLYRWRNPETPILQLPAWVLAAVTTRQQRQAMPANHRGGGHTGPLPSGQRHSGLLSYAGHLANTGRSVDEMMPIFMERYRDCVQPPGAVPGARYEDPNCVDVFTEQEARALLVDVLTRYPAEVSGADIVAEWVSSAPSLLVRQRQLPPFPTDSLPSPLASMVSAVAEFTQTDPGMAGTTCLAVLAAAAGGRVQLEVRRGWREPVNLFTATVAGPGERKSAVQAAMSAPLQEAESELTERVRGQHLEINLTKEVALKAAEAARKKASHASDDQHDEYLAQAISAMQAAENIEVPAMPRLLADDVTPERCAGLLAEQGGRLAVISAEGGIFDIIAGRYSGGIPSLDVWLKGHSGDPLRIDRQSRETQFIAQPALTLSLMVQPSVLTAIAQNRDFRGRGLLARFLYALPISKVGSRQVDGAVVPEDVSGEYHGRVKRLTLSLAGWTDPAVLQLSPQSAQMLNEVARRLEPQLGPDCELGHIADWGSKFVGAVARIAALVHLAEHPDDGWRLQVEAASMERAVALGEYYKGQALYAFDQMRVDPAIAEAEYVLGVARRLGTRSVSRRDLHVAASRSRFPTAKSLDGPLKVLEEHGYLLREQETPPKGRGRPPSTTWLVHPSVTDGPAEE